MSAQSAPAAAQATTMDEQPTEETLTPALSQREREQEADDVDTELAGEASVLGQEEQALAPARAHSEREQEAAAARQAAADRVRQAPGLLPGLRERLASVVAAGGEIGADGRTLVSLDDALQALAESLPGALRLDEAHLQRAEHPGGGAFFRATPEGELSDDEADEIARGQLARSGLLRGQRVRVAQD